MACTLALEPDSPARSCGHIVRKREAPGKGGTYSQMTRACALGHVDVEVVLVGLVGLGPEHRAEDLAGRAMGGAQELGLDLRQNGERGCWRRRSVSRLGTAEPVRRR